jgi:hypothetical protein
VYIRRFKVGNDKSYIHHAEDFDVKRGFIAPKPDTPDEDITTTKKGSGRSKNIRKEDGAIVSIQLPPRSSRVRRALDALPTGGEASMCDALAVRFDAAGARSTALRIKPAKPTKLKPAKQTKRMRSSSGEEEGDEGEDGGSSDTEDEQNDTLYSSSRKGVKIAKDK